MSQLDWTVQQAQKHSRLLKLREIIATELKRKLPFSGSSVKITLSMIRVHHGEEAEQETRNIFGLTEDNAS